MIEALVRRFLYHPIRLRADEPPPRWAAGAEEIWLETDRGDRLHGLWWPPPAGRPAILFFHGNAQSVFEWALVRGDLAALECGLLLVDYPGYGKSSGTPTEAGLLATGRAALEWARATAGLAPRDLVAFGKSLGGPVAAEVGAHEPGLRGVVLESTFRSIPHVARNLLPMIPVDALLASERYDTAARVARLRAPLLVVHGEDDELIPASEGVALHEAATCPKALYLVSGAGHNDVAHVAGRGYGRRLREWLDAT
jgi:hypothetical protein